MLLSLMTAWFPILPLVRENALFRPTHNTTFLLKSHPVKHGPAFFTHEPKPDLRMFSFLWSAFCLSVLDSSVNKIVSKRICRK